MMRSHYYYILNKDKKEPPPQAPRPPAPPPSSHCTVSTCFMIVESYKAVKSIYYPYLKKKMPNVQPKTLVFFSFAFIF